MIDTLDYQAFMKPLLALSADGREWTLADARDRIAADFGLTDDDLRARLPSGRQTVFSNRVGWAKTYLTKAGLLESPRRGVFRLTPRGRRALDEAPRTIDNDYLRRFEEFVDFEQKGGPANAASDAFAQMAPAADDDATPEEALDRAHQQLRRALASEILDQVKAVSPERFEQLVVELLVRMGYGGSRAEAGQALGRSGDEGIDGIIKEDRLGLDIIYLQAKRWTDAPVGRPEVQKFAGALQGKRARKGIFITTSRFTSDAREYVSLIESKIILIDGEQLAELMIDSGTGVTTVETYEVKRVDTDYFVEG